VRSAYAIGVSLFHYVFLGVLEVMATAVVESIDGLGRRRLVAIVRDRAVKDVQAYLV
jgi:hypothetical protein